jgi:hypothetical protein
MWQFKYLAIAPLSLAALLGLGGSVWLAKGALLPDTSFIAVGSLTFS